MKQSQACEGNVRIGEPAGCLTTTTGSNQNDPLEGLKWLVETYALCRRVGK